MEKLNLPIFAGPLPEPRTLSMGDYLKFVEFNLKYTINIEAAREWKKKISVDVPFKIK